MEFIKQTIQGRYGNCLEACISSLTGIPIDHFPNQEKVASDDPILTKTLNEWLQENHGIYVESICYRDKLPFKHGVVIASIPSFVDGETHAVLWDFENERIVFDPALSPSSVESKPKHFIIIVKYYTLTKEKGE